MPLTKPERFLLFAIMLLAALLRASYLMQIEHNVDHAYPIWQALQTLDRGVFPLAGQGTSVLFANPALTGYLYLPVVALTHSPIGVYVFVIALNTLAVLLAFKATRTLLGTYPALIAAALMAVNPWVIEYSRASWVQSLLPFFNCALAWLLFPILTGTSRRPARRMLIFMVTLTAFTQTYLLSFAILAPIGLLMLIFWRRVPWRAVAAGGVVFAAALALYGMGLLQQWDSVQEKLAGFTSAQATFRTDALEHALRLVTGNGYPVARGMDAPTRDWERRENLSQIAHVFLSAAVFIGIALAVGSLLRGKQKITDKSKSSSAMFHYRDSAIILLILFGVPILLMTRVGQNVHPFYLLLTLPAGYALAGWALAAIYSSRVLRLVLNGLFVPFAILMSINSARYAQETQATPGRHDLYALPLDYGLQLGSVINENLPESGVVFAEVEDWILNSFAGQTFLGIRDNNLIIVPQNGGLYVYMRVMDFFPLANRWLGYNLNDDVASIYLSPTQVIIQVAAIPRTETIQPDNPSNIPSQQGITLMGHQIASPVVFLDGSESDWRLTTYWRVDNRAPEIDTLLFAPFAHIFDANGNRVLVVDGSPVPGYNWFAGDVHVHTMTFELSADAPAPFTIQIGQYDAGNAQNVIFVLADGTTNATVTLPESITP